MYIVYLNSKPSNPSFAHSFFDNVSADVFRCKRSLEHRRLVWCL